VFDHVIQLEAQVLKCANPSVQQECGAAVVKELQRWAPISGSLRVSADECRLADCIGAFKHPCHSSATLRTAYAGMPVVMARGVPRLRRQIRAIVLDQYWI